MKKETPPPLCHLLSPQFRLLDTQLFSPQCLRQLRFGSATHDRTNTKEPRDRGLFLQRSGRQSRAGMTAPGSRGPRCFLSCCPAILNRLPHGSRSCLGATPHIHIPGEEEMKRNKPRFLILRTREVSTTIATMDYWSQHHLKGG